jgi:biotin carboxyl carrier protein
MELIVRIREREERVTVRRVAAGYEVTLGAKVYQVDAAAVRGSLWSLCFDGKQCEAAVCGAGSGSYQVSGRDAAWPVEVSDPLAHLARQAEAASGVRKRRRVTAYMPGRVVSLLVEEGAEVKAGQGILVLEAMKMQNEIEAEHDGVISRILVESGQSVDGGAPLFELE